MFAVDKTHNICIQIKQKELTKTFRMISNRNKPLVSIVCTQIFQCCNSLKYHVVPGVNFTIDIAARGKNVINPLPLIVTISYRKCCTILEKIPKKTYLWNRLIPLLNNKINVAELKHLYSNKETRSLSPYGR